MKEIQWLSSARARLQKLYQNLGGKPESLETIVIDFYRRMSRDVLIGFFFQGKDVDEVARTQTRFILNAMGIEKTYTGKIPAKAHDNLAPILPGHFDRRTTILEETLRDHGLEAEDIRTWVGFERAFRDAILETEAKKRIR